MSDNKIVIIGYSGHGLVVAEAAKTSGMNLQCYTENKKMSINPFYLDYLGYEGDAVFPHWGQTL